MGSAEMRSLRWLACLLVTGSILANNSLNSKMPMRKKSLVAFRVVAQLLHCTREWYSSHWARRSSAGRTHKLLRRSSSWDAAENPQETLKIYADMRYVFKRQNSLPTSYHQPTGYLTERLSGRVPLPWQPVNKQSSRKSRRHAKTGSTQKPHKPISRKSRQHAKHVRNFLNNHA